MNNSKVIVLKDYVIINNKLVPKITASSLEASPAEKENILVTKPGTKAVTEERAPSFVFEEECGAGEQVLAEITENTANQQHMWDDSTTLVLLDEYENSLRDFRNPKVKKKVLWDKIAQSLREKNYANVDGTYLDQKFRNMKNTFKKIKDNNKTSATGRGRINWKYFDRFEQIFACDKTINPPTVISSTISLNDEQSSSDAENSNPAVTPTSSRTSIPDVNRKSFTRLDAFRKRQLTLEEARLDELKAIRLEIAEGSRINRDKLALLKQHLDACHNK